jgi:hypothetical protein
VQSHTIGISNAGRPAEELLKRLTGYQEPEVEVKLVDGQNTGTKTINQVRAASLAPLCVYHAPKDQWYVVPPARVLSMIRHRKGQHGVSSLENCTLSLDRVAAYKCPVNRLAKTIQDSFVSSILKDRARLLAKIYAESVNRANIEYHSNWESLLREISTASSLSSINT